MKSAYKVTYSGTRHFNTYSSKKKAVEQAKYAVGTGNMLSCIFKKMPSGGWHKMRCVSRYGKRGRR